MKTRRLKLTEEGRYSYTRPQDSKEIIKVMKDILGDLKTKTITDATANIGGDTIAFARHFKHVIAIEIKSDNFEALRENTQRFQNVELIHGDSIKLYTHTDVLYIDAPWGGPDYKLKESIDLFLGDIRLDEWIAKLNKVFIFLKVPCNYNFDRLDTFKYVKYKIRKFYLVFIACNHEHK